MGGVRSITEPTVSLAYFGPNPDQLHQVTSALRVHGLRATFFVSAEEVLEDPIAWRSASEEGHELAAHPFLGFTEDGSLPLWTLAAVEFEISSIRQFFREAVGVEVQGFCFPGPDSLCAEGDYGCVIRDQFRYALAWQGGFNEQISDPQKLRVIRASTFDESLVDRFLGLHPQQPKPRWGIFGFNEYGEIHQRTLDFVVQWLPKLRVAPVGDVLNL